MGVLGNLEDTVFSFSGGFVSGFLGFFHDLWDKLTGHSIIPDMISDIITAFKDLPGKLLTIGGDIVQGLINGVKNKLGDVKNAIGSIGGGIIDGFKKQLGIASPSSVFFEHGQNLMAGLAGGIKSGALSVNNAFGTIGLPGVSGGM